MNAHRVLILGGAGMLGHKVWQVFRERFATWVTFRSSVREYAALGLFDADRAIGGVNAQDLDAVVRACAAVRPTVIVNCVGIVKQLSAAKDAVASLTVNALFPHRLADVCRAIDARLIQIGTDCVFSGTKGRYTESDRPDADDLYGRTKLLGEVRNGSALTVRTSIIGRELCETTGLIEWMLSHRGGRIDGYRGAIFSGLTTHALANILADVVEHHPDLAGLYNVASAPINKYDLLCDLNQAFAAGITITPSDRIQLDRSLDGSRFVAATGVAVPRWAEMMRELAADASPYEQWRTLRVS
jgi:dTDP-4-dehydrorhamnose reductase